MLTRGKLAKQTGCNAETIRYFEKIGWLKIPDRSDSGYRLYSEEDQRRLLFILKAKELGFDTASIASLLEISDGGDTFTRSEVKSLTESHITEVTRKIKDLQQLKKRLVEISSHCDGSSASAQQCPIITSLFGHESNNHDQSNS